MILYNSVPTNADPPSNHPPLWRRSLAYVAACLVSACLVHLYDRTTGMKRLTSIQFLPESNAKTDPDPAAPWPRLAWLMSFPNSGTTYTIDLIGNVTNTTTATNYGLESPGQTGVPVYNSSPNGPFLFHPFLPMPERYIMTKTHCGGRCTDCSPDAYTETFHSFERMCRLGSKMVNDVKVRFTYDVAAERAIHLIRSPFDNLVARLHLERKEWASRGDHADFLDRFTDSKQGLVAWCRYLDTKRTQEEQQSHFIDSDLLEEEQAVPCHAEFYRYIQWHNLAFEVTQRKRLPTHLLYYEDYSSNFDETVAQLLNFLELRAIAPAPEFIKGKHYGDYFEPHECQATARLAKELASPESWSALHQYFDPWL